MIVGWDGRQVEIRNVNCLQVRGGASPTLQVVAAKEIEDG